MSTEYPTGQELATRPRQTITVYRVTSRNYADDGGRERINYTCIPVQADYRQAQGMADGREYGLAYSRDEAEPVMEITLPQGWECYQTAKAAEAGDWSEWYVQGVAKWQADQAARGGVTLTTMSDFGDAGQGWPLKRLVTEVRSGRPPKGLEWHKIAV